MLCVIRVLLLCCALCVVCLCMSVRVIRVVVCCDVCCLRGVFVCLCVGLITSFFTAFTISRLMVSKYLMVNKDKIISI